MEPPSPKKDATFKTSDSAAEHSQNEEAASWSSREVNRQVPTGTDISEGQAVSEERSSPSRSISPEEVKSKLSDVTEPDEVDRFKTLQQDFFGLKWPEVARADGLMPRLLNKFEHESIAPAEDAAPALKAHHKFHKAVLAFRIGDRALADECLKLAWSQDPGTVIQELELAITLINIDKKKSSCAEVDTAENSLDEGRKRYSLQAHLKLMEFAYGLYAESGIPAKLSKTPGLVFELLKCLKRKPQMEMTFTNSLELSYQLYSPQFLHDQSISDEVIVAYQLIWYPMDSYGKYIQKDIPACHGGRGLSTDDYEGLSRILATFSWDDGSKPLREQMSQNRILRTHQLLLKLGRIKASEQLTYTQAFACFVRALCHEKRLFQEPSAKTCADEYFQAAQYPLFSALYKNAGEQYEKSMCYREAIYCSAQVMAAEKEPDKLELWQDKINDLLELAEEREQFIAEVEAMTLENPEDTQAVKKKKKKKKAKKEMSPEPEQGLKQPEVPATAREEASLQASGQGQSLAEPGPLPSASEGPARNHSKSVHPQPKAQPPAAFPPYFGWNRKVTQALNEFYQARLKDNFPKEKAILESAKIRLSGCQEEYEIFLEAAWHHLRQLDLHSADRVSLNKQGQPASHKELCSMAVSQTAMAFSRLTGIKVNQWITPDRIKALLLEHYPPQSPVPPEEKRFRRALRKVMSTFGHCYGKMADLKDSSPVTARHSREFYQLKKVANPDYYKTTRDNPLSDPKIKLISSELFATLRVD